MPQAASRRYRNATTRRLYIRRLGVVVDPGEEFDCPWPLDDASYEEVKQKAPASPAQPVVPAKEV